MNRKAISGIIILTMLLTGVLTLAFNVQPVKAWTGTVYIRADGSIDPPDAPIITHDNIAYTLTDNITSVGDGIVVERDNIIIDGNGYMLQGAGDYESKGIVLSGRTNVTVRNAQIQNFGHGIWLNYSNSNSISDNNITNTWIGVWFYNSSNHNSINGNNITANKGSGIWLDGSSDNSISGNTVTANGMRFTSYGIGLSKSSNNSISGNTVTANTGGGILLQHSSYNSISGNNITANNKYGIYLSVSSNNNVSRNTFISDGLLAVAHSYQNVVEDNTINGKPLVYLEGVADYRVENAGQVILVNCTGIRVENLNLSRTDVGVELWKTDNSIISGNNITNNFGGIRLDESSNHNGIWGNNITTNYVGIELYDYSNNNIISGNNITNNEYGIWLTDSSNNIIYHNNFINNGQQVFFGSSRYANVWDNGYPSGGNYWSDYAGVDLYSGPFQNETGSDGIGDTPYVIDENNTDRYPLMHPWSSLPVHNINTGLGYAAIQEAINANETINGHTIFVETGIYYEHVIVNKSLSLIGENKDTTIIDGNGTGKVVMISADYVAFSGFKVQNSGPYDPIEIYRGSGISLHPSRGSVIVDNIVTENYEGIELWFSDDTTIVHNTISNNSVGIETWRSSGNTMENNTIWFNGQGVTVDYSSGSNTISGNNITSNIWYGVLISTAGYGNVISENIIALHRIGIGLVNANGTTLLHNFILNNEEGLSLRSSNNNNIISNTVSKNERGVFMDSDSNDNMFYHNNFVENTEQTYICMSVNTWDDGYPSGGNYWSDYTGVDADGDGIGDTPYIIDADNQDRYPLMNPWGAGTPVASFVWSPSIPEVDELVTFNASASMPIGGEIVSYEWDFGDGNYASGKIVTHRYSTAGTFTVTLNVTDSEGLWDIEQKQIEVKAPPPPLTVSISPTSASILVGQSVTFASTVSGGYTPYTYQWYLNGNPVSGATSDTWTFTPTTSGIYYVYLKVTDAKGNTAQSETARTEVAAVPVGGYSYPIQLPTTAKPVNAYFALLTILTAIFVVKLRRRTKKH